jgi:uncharacterized protein (UPF0261 family)
MKRTIAIVGTMDTKSQELSFMRDLIGQAGYGTLLVDVGVFDQDNIKPDIGREETALAGGMAIEELISKNDRSLAVQTMSRGGARILQRLYEDGSFQAIISLGGGTGTHIAAGIMRELPTGIPKLILSTVVARDMSEVVGGKDITLMHATCDLMGLNFMTKKMLSDAAGAIVGMLDYAKGFTTQKPVVGLTSYGPLNDCAFRATEILTGLGYEVVPFHAVGSGSMAMEDLVEQGVIHGVVDLSLHEFVDHLHGGYCGAIGPQRLATAGEKGVPHVVLPGGLDMVALECTSHEQVPSSLRDRKFISHDFRSFVRTTNDDMVKVATVIAERLEAGRLSPTLIIPLDGWSKADSPGGPFYDPGVNKVFIDEVKGRLSPSVNVLEFNGNINDEECARLAAYELHRLMNSSVARRSQHGPASG